MELWMRTLRRRYSTSCFPLLKLWRRRAGPFCKSSKDKGIANEEELAPYLKRAGDSSSVRWYAARARMDHLLSSAIKAADRDAKREPAETSPEPKRNTGADDSRGRESAQTAQPLAEMKGVAPLLPSCMVGTLAWARDNVPPE